MPTTFTADPSAIEGLSRQLQQAVADLDHEVARLDAAAATLATQWTGEAADAYQRAQRDWLAQMSSRSAELGRLVAALTHAVTTYTTAENEVQRVAGV